MTATQATPPRGQGQAAVPVGGDRAWPDRETTRQARPQHTRPHWCGGRRRDLPRCRWAVAGPGQIARQRAKPDLSTPGPTGVEGAGGICHGAGGRRQGLAGLRGDAPSHTSATRPHWCEGRRRDRRARAGFEARRRAKRGCLASRAAGPSGARNTRGHTKPPGHRGRAAQSVSEAHRRTTTMSGSPRPLSWRTLEIPSLAATSFAVPSMRGSS